MNNDPLFLLMVSAVGLYVATLWRADYRNALAGRSSPVALPGATPVPAQACLVAALGGLVLTLLETWGEIQLGLSAEQSQMTVLFGGYTLLAAFIEELVFRGFIVIEGRGATAKWAGAFGASVLFAVLHPFLWTLDLGAAPFWKIWEWEWNWAWKLNLKGWFSTVAVFAASLWFYAMRFTVRLNPRGSLLPSFAAHGAKNLAVFAIKAAQGFVVGAW